MNWYIDVLKRYAQFSGRARRKEYWMFMLFNTAIYFGVYISQMTLRLPYLSGIYSLITFIPTLAVSVRRKHDIGRSGWLVIVPIVDTVMACMPGNIGPNEYGPDPKAAKEHTFGAEDYIRPVDTDVEK